MSASLVGSEMCIRDRYEGGERHGQQVAGWTWKQQLGLQWKALALSTKSCLLYTSDAADDM
eukprot:11878133-Alexandrium_andersonii.AAC.1